MKPCNIDDIKDHDEDDFEDDFEDDVDGFEDDEDGWWLVVYDDDEDGWWIVVYWTILFAGSNGLVAECPPALARFSQFTRFTITTHFPHDDDDDAGLWKPDFHNIPTLQTQHTSMMNNINTLNPS